MSDSPPPPPPSGYPPPYVPGPPQAPGAPGVPAPGAYGAPPAGPPPTQPGWGAGGGVPPYGGAPPPSGGGGSRPLIIALIVILGLAALVVVAAVVLIVVAGNDDNDAPSVVRTTLPSATAPTIPPVTSTTEGPQPGDSALDPDTTDVTTEATAAPGEAINVFDLSVGDCFDVPSSGNITDVNGIDCDEPHENEVFAIFEIAGDDEAPFPGVASISRRAQRRCTGNLFTEYVGVPFGESRFNATSINPTRDTWESALNDREVICVATSGDDSPLTASVQDAAE